MTTTPTTPLTSLVRHDVERQFDLWRHGFTTRVNVNVWGAAWWLSPTQAVRDHIAALIATEGQDPQLLDECVTAWLTYASDIDGLMLALYGTPRPVVVK